MKQTSFLPSPEPADNCEWYTPRYIIEAVRKVMGEITLDPTSCEAAQRVVQADTYYTAEQDGLQHEWHGCVWLNPPYGRGLMDRFVDKILTEIAEERVRMAIVLTHNCTETDWWQQLAEYAIAICFPNHRLHFWGPLLSADNPQRGQTLFLLHGRVCAPDTSEERFYDEFGRMGFVLPGGGAG